MEQFEQYRPMMFSIAYRMLGSVMEAEDVVQEAYLRYQATSPDTIQSHRAFLGTVVTRLSLDHLKSAKVQRETYIGPWLPEPVRTDDNPEIVTSEHDSVSMAFLVLLESLTPVERAIFLLREVFDYDYREIADIVDKTEVACRKLFSRAKKHIVSNRPRFESTPDEHKTLVTRFFHTVVTGDMDALMSMLTMDVALYSDGGGKVSAARKPILGRKLVAKFLTNLQRMRDKHDDHSVDFIEVNGQSSIALRNESGQVTSLFTIEIDNGLIRAFHVQRNPEKLSML